MPTFAGSRLSNVKFCCLCLFHTKYVWVLDCLNKRELVIAIFHFFLLHLDPKAPKQTWTVFCSIGHPIPFWPSRTSGQDSIKSVPSKRIYSTITILPALPLMDNSHNYKGCSSTLEHKQMSGKYCTFAEMTDAVAFMVSLVYTSLSVCIYSISPSRHGHDRIRMWTLVAMQTWKVQSHWLSSDNVASGGNV